MQGDGFKIISDDNNQTLAAIKFFPKNYSLDKIAKESRILSSYFFSFVPKDYPCIVMEYLPGETLFDDDPAAFTHLKMLDLSLLKVILANTFTVSALNTIIQKYENHREKCNWLYRFFTSAEEEESFSVAEKLHGVSVRKVSGADRFQKVKVETVTDQSRLEMALEHILLKPETQFAKFLLA